MTILKAFDLTVLNFIYNNMHGNVLDRIMVIVTSLGDMGLVWIALSAILICMPKYRRAGILTIGAVLLCTALGEGIIKHLVERPRPFLSVPAVNMLISKPLTYSFPSGHTATAFAAAGVLSCMLKRYRVYFFSLAALIAFSRMYLYVHYPTDILAGIILGIISSKLVLYLSDFYDQKKGQKLKNINF